MWVCCTLVIYIISYTQKSDHSREKAYLMPQDNLVCCPLCGITILSNRAPCHTLTLVSGWVFHMSLYMTYMTLMFGLCRYLKVLVVFQYCVCRICCHANDQVSIFCLLLHCRDYNILKKHI